MCKANDDMDLNTDDAVSDGHASPYLNLSNESCASEDPEYAPDLMDNEKQDDSAKDATDDDRKSVELEHGEEEESVSQAGSPSGDLSPSLGLIRNLSHSAIGDEDRKLPFVSLVASKTREAWLTDLAASGYAGLLYAHMETLRNQNCFTLSWWFKNRKHLRRRLVQTPLESVPTAGIFTFQRALPGGSLINSVVCTVAELVASDKDVSYCASTLQLFIPSEGGFSQDFRLDDVQNSTNFPCYRCFWYFGPDEEGPAEDWVISAERDGIFLGSAGDNVKMFGGQKVITLAGYFGEGDRKFRLHAGDILLESTKYPFAVDLPIGGRAKGARVLSWLVFPEQENETLPRVLPESEIMMNIENFISSNEEARESYNAEFENFEINPGPIGDPEGYM